MTLRISMRFSIYLVLPAKAGERSGVRCPGRVGRPGVALTAAAGFANQYTFCAIAGTHFCSLSEAEDEEGQVRRERPRFSVERGTGSATMNHLQGSASFEALPAELKFHPFRAKKSVTYTCAPRVLTRAVKAAVTPCAVTCVPCSRSRFSSSSTVCGLGCGGAWR